MRCCECWGQVTTAYRGDYEIVCRSPFQQRIIQTYALDDVDVLQCIYKHKDAQIWSRNNHCCLNVVTCHFLLASFDPICPPLILSAPLRSYLPPTPVDEYKGKWGFHQYPVDITYISLLSWLGDVAVSFEVWFSNSLYRIQASAIITRSNIVRYYINDYRNWGRISIRCWIHERCPIPCPNRWAMGCFCEKIDRIIMAPHCSSLGIYYEITVRWMLWNLNNKSFMSTLVQVMAWCLQVTSHYLNQC